MWKNCKNRNTKKNRKKSQKIVKNRQKSSKITTNCQKVAKNEQNSSKISKKNRKPIAVVGVRDCVIVQTDDTTLVAHKKATAKTRELVAKLAADKAYRNLT